MAMLHNQRASVTSFGFPNFNPSPHTLTGARWGGAPKESAGDAGCRTGTGTNGAGLWIFTRQQKRDEARDVLSVSFLSKNSVGIDTLW